MKKNKTIVILLTCRNDIIKSINNKKKYCNYKCSNNRKRTQEELDKISKASKEKFIKNPELRKICADNGMRIMKYINENGLAFRMPIGYHSEEHKKYMSELMTGREIKWKDKIKESHWSTDPIKREKTLEKIKKSKEISVKWNSEERRNILANWAMNNPDKIGNKSYKRGKYKNRKRNQYEYYASGFERDFMKQLDADDDVVDWTNKHGIIIEYKINDKVRRYFPDIFVEYKTGEKKLIETKGRIYDIDVVLAKIDAAEKWCDNNGMVYDIIFQRSSDDPR